MSDTSEDNSNKTDRQTDREDSVCRDFVRGMCDRKFCKYKHETESRPLNFCHDFQNNVCPRPKCKFIHCTSDEVEEYKRTGQMSNQIFAEATRKSQLPGLPPVCNQFRKGICRRPNCKYRHLTCEEEEAEIMELIHNNQRKCQFVTNIPEIPITLDPMNGLARINAVIQEDYNDCGSPLRKRRLITHEHEFRQDIHPLEANRPCPIFKGYFAGNPPTTMLTGADARIIMLEEENNLLHKEVAQLKRQVSDLTATNEFLLDQNANLRVSTKHNGGVNVPNVTITNGNASQQQVIRTVTASIATVPVSLATVTTCNPVSCNPVSIAGVPSVSIASPAQLLAPSQQILVTTNPSTQLALANSSQAQLAIAQQNLANNLAQQAQPQLTSQAQQLALATTTQQLNSQAQHMANQQLALATTPQQLNQQLTSQAQQLANQQLTNQQLTSQAQQLANQQLTNQQLTSQAQHLANQQLTSQAQQLASQQLASQAQQLTSQAQQLALASTTQQLTSQAQLALASTTQQLTSQAQLALASTTQQLTSQAQLAIANTPQQLAVANMPQQLSMASANQQLLAQQNLTSQHMAIHRNNQFSAINTQTIAMSNATPAMMSYPIVTHSINHALSH